MSKTYQLKTRAEKLKDRIAEAKAEIERWTEELTSADTIENDISRAKPGQADVV